VIDPRDLLPPTCDHAWEDAEIPTLRPGYLLDLPDHRTPTVPVPFAVPITPVAGVRCRRCGQTLPTNTAAPV
jgi:hypothetical protein